MFRFFETLLNPTLDAADTTPPAGLLAFYWHYARQARGLLVALFVAGTVVALMDLLIPIFIGRVVDLVSAHTPEEVLRDHWAELADMALVQLCVRPLILLGQNLIAN